MAYSRLCVRRKHEGKNYLLLCNTIRSTTSIGHVHISAQILVLLSLYFTNC